MGSGLIFPRHLIPVEARGAHARRAGGALTVSFVATGTQVWVATKAVFEPMQSDGGPRKAPCGGVR